MLIFTWFQTETSPLYLIIISNEKQIGIIKYSKNKYLLEIFHSIELSLEELEEIVNKMKEMNKC